MRFGLILPSFSFPDLDYAKAARLREFAVRAEALGYDLRRPHYVVVIDTGRGGDNTRLAAVGRAAGTLNLNHLLGRQGSLVVLLADGHPDPAVLHREISRQLGHSSSAIGIGSRCEAPNDFPSSFRRARRALNIRLNSANPQGASDYDELGFYHLVDAAGPVIIQTFEWEGLPGHVALETMRLEDLGGGKTRMVQESVFQTVEDRDGAANSGMQDGAAETHDRLAEVVAGLLKAKRNR